MQRLPSPNFDDRDGQPIDMLVLHYTGMQSAEDALARLCDPQAKVSAHYVVDEDGDVIRLVEEERRAWHAGVSSWRGQTNINARSIGIEIVNPGHEFGYRPFPDVQMRAVALLCQQIVARHAIAPRNVVGHSDVAPTRKEDPGELFDWAGLARAGVGLFSHAHGTQEALLSPHDRGEAVRALQEDLARYGYGIQPTGEFDELTRACVIAFQRHFRPERLTGVWDGQCAARLAQLPDLA